MFDLVVENDLAQLRLNRPAAHNAIPLEGWAELAAKVEEAQARARLLIVSGDGGAFCAGADISSFDSFRDDPAARTDFRLAIRIALDRLHHTPIPSIAVVEGGCYGAGVALAMACDIRLAGVHARFAITPAKLGISYPQEDVHRLVTLVGAGQAARLLFGAQTVDGAEAERIGLVDAWHLADLDDAVSAFAAAILANDPASLRTLKRGIALAADGVRRDEQQDRDFDALLGSDALTARLAEHRDRRR